MSIDRNISARAVLLQLSVICISLIPSGVTSAQDIGTDKLSLGLLVSKLRVLDAEDLERAQAIEKAGVEKGEFETTAKFEARQKKAEADAQNLRSNVAYQDDGKRLEVYRQIDSLLSRSYSGTIDAELGTYDADKQRFPLIVDGDLYEYLDVPLPEAPAFKAAFPKAHVAARRALSVGADDKASDYIIDGKVTVGERTYLIQKQLLGVPQALLIAFGNFESSNSTSRWRRSAENYEDDSVMRPMHLQNMVVAKAKVLTLGTSDIRKLMVAISTGSEAFNPPEDFVCHGCGVILSVAEIVKDGSGWRMVHLRKQITIDGGWGDGPFPKLVSLGADNPVLWFDLSYMQMGYQTSWTEIIGLSDGFRRVAYIETASNNLGAIPEGKDAESYKSTLSVLPAGDQKYPPIRVVTTGRKAKLSGKKFVMAPFNKTTIFRFNGIKYEVQ